MDGLDAALFKTDFGRSSILNPCPTCPPLEPVLKTGQVECYDELGNTIDCEGTGQDGEYQMGYERYIDNGHGTVTDNFTKLMWLKDVNCIKTNYSTFDQDNHLSEIGDGLVQWQHALDFVKGINDGTFPLCGGGKTDWRLPNINELFSCIGTLSLQQSPFLNAQSYSYWSSTTNHNLTACALAVGWGSGGIGEQYYKINDYPVLPVRGGQ